jgi:AraC-like DNA-binding protein
MKDYRPLLLQTIDVRLPGLRLRRLRLHQHLPQTDSIDDHSHRFCQVLCYLSGTGTLRVAGRDYQVLPGSVALLPAGIVHGFRESPGRRPLSLAADFDWQGAIDFRCCLLDQSARAGIRRELSELSRLRDPHSAAERLRAAAAALTILDLELRAVGVLPREARAVPGFVKKFIRLAGEPAGAGQSIARLAAATGYQPDYLNRRFKQFTGLTLLQQRDVLRVGKAKRLLRQGVAVHAVAAAVGLDDPNYFSRWFKRQAGVTPSHYAGHPGW